MITVRRYYNIPIICLGCGQAFTGMAEDHFRDIHLRGKQKEDKK